MSEPTREQVEFRARSLMALPESEQQRILTAAESIEHWNLAYREEKKITAELLRRLTEAEKLLVIVTDEWWPYVHDRCTIQSIIDLKKKVTAHFTPKT